MRNIKNWITLGAFSLLVLGMPAIASAQYGGYDPYGRDDRYGRQNDPYYNRGGNYGNMSVVVRSLKDRTREFVRQLDRDLDRSRMNGTRREDQINAQAKHFRNAVNRINNNNNNNWGRRDNNIERALQMGAELDRSISRVRLSYQSQALWQGISRDLQMLGNGYGYDTRNNRGNRSGGGWNNGRMPTWWPF
jgi:hypothetical protein